MECIGELGSTLVLLCEALAAIGDMQPAVITPALVDIITILKQLKGQGNPAADKSINLLLDPWGGQRDMSPLHFYILKVFFEKNGPRGRVVSAADWQAWGPGFDSSRFPNFFRRNQV